MHPLLNVAVSAARKGGNALIRSSRRLDELNVNQKGRNDFVSDADRTAEAKIIEEIRKHYPEHGILAEESGLMPGTDDAVVWIIDPLDGTNNFIHGFPTYAVSIAVKVNDRLSQGVVYDPMRQELFTASKGDGAQLDGKRIRVSGRTHLRESLIGTGFPYRESQTGGVDAYLSLLKLVLENTAGIRRAGSAALDLAYVASGRLDAFWEFGLKSWDIAAGALLIREAGGIISGVDGSEDFLDKGHVLAGTPKVYVALAAQMARHSRDAIDTLSA
ncbi:MAG: inositol monophosphatase family protein [Pseudomonadota bacterium]